MISGYGICMAGEEKPVTFLLGKIEFILLFYFIYLSYLY
jgi:hypothetical protein